MDQNEKKANDKITKLENEIKVLKNEVQAVLLDLRESYLNMENPFNAAASPAAAQSIVITGSNPVKESRPECQSANNPAPGPIKSEKDSLAERREPEALKPAQENESESFEATDPEMEELQETVKITPNSHLKQSNQPLKSTETGASRKAKLDLVTVAGLTGWVEESTRKIGRERTEAVLDISEAMGFVAADLRPILVKLISLSPSGTDGNAARTRDYIDSLAKLNSLLGKDNREETALLLLSLVSGDTGHG